MKKTISSSIILVGFTAMASQIVYMREFLTVFYGNELSIGFILASWLMAGAIGSSVLGRFADRIRFKVSAFALCQTLLSLLLPLGILAIRSIKIILNINIGEIVPFFSIALSSLAILAPICIILGFMFSLACRIYESKVALGAVKIGRVYVLEAIGAMIGGLFTSFILIRLLNSIEIMAVLSLLNIIASISLLSSTNESRLKVLFLTIASIIFIIGISMWPLKAWARLNGSSLKNEWRGYELIASKNSIYGNIAVVKRFGQTSFFDNGLHLYTIPDEFTSEEAVHYALLEHANPRRVLLVGGGVGGLISQILKHPIERVDYVELDPLIIKMAKDYLPDAYHKPLEDSRVSIENEDGRLFIKRTDERYDCIVIHLGDPYTAQLNRYYTVEFFEEINRVLKKGGVVSFGLSSSESYINEELGEFLRSIYATLSEVFEDVKIIPGDTAYFLASNQKEVLTYDYSVLVERARGRRLDIKYVREYYLFSKLSPQKIAYMENSVKRKSGAKINYDFKPISYYYGIIFWAARFRDSLFTKTLKTMAGRNAWKAASAVYLFIILLIGLSIIRYKRFHKNAVLLAVMATGFSGMAFQVILLLSFQIIYGYLFYKLGLMLTSFMIGLTLGGWLGIKIMPFLKRDLTAFIWSECAVSVYPLVLPVFFGWLVNSKSDIVSWAGLNILFPSLPIMAGFIGGFQFPLANKIYLGEDDRIGRASGLSYGIDLLGSCLGAVLTGAFLIPILGIPKACLAVAILNFTVLTLLVLSRMRLERIS